MKKYLPGILISIIISFVAILLTDYIPYLGKTTIALIIGILITHEKLTKGAKLIEKKILPIGIALLGATISVETAKNIGGKGILLVLTIITVTIISSVIIGKLFKVRRDFALLIGTGNAVCGSSAILTASKVLGNDEEEVATSVALINFLGVIGTFVIPFIAGILFKNLNQSSILIGSVLQSVGNVTAASSFIEGSFNLAIMTKMLRVASLSIVVIALSFIGNKNNKKKIGLPLFIIFFIGLFVLANLNLNVLPETIINIKGTLINIKETVINTKEILININKKVSSFLILISMSAIGLSINIKSVVTLGKEGLKLAMINWIIQIITVITFIYLVF